MLRYFYKFQSITSGLYWHQPPNMIWLHIKFWSRVWLYAYCSVLGLTTISCNVALLFISSWLVSILDNHSSLFNIHCMVYLRLWKNVLPCHNLHMETTRKKEESNNAFVQVIELLQTYWGWNTFQKKSIISRYHNGRLGIVLDFQNLFWKI